MFTPRGAGLSVEESQRFATSAPTKKINLFSMKYFWSLLAIVAGFFIVKYSNIIVQSFGYVNWAEKNLGTSGGTRLMWKIIGILFIAGGILVISGGMNIILYSIFVPITRNGI